MTEDRHEIKGCFRMVLGVAAYTVMMFIRHPGRLRDAWRMSGE